MSDQFWDNIESNETADMGGGNFTPMPEGTQVLASIAEVEWTNYEGDTYISAQWDVLKPDEFNNRKVFQKIKVLDQDPKKAEKAKKMLAAIDKNASGGKLMALGKKPTDMDLIRNLVGKPMVLKLGVWEMNDKSGNWVQCIAPKTPEPIPAPAAKKPVPTVNDDFDGSDIPW